MAVALAGCHAERPASHSPSQPAVAAPLVPTLRCATSPSADPTIGVVVDDPHELMHGGGGQVQWAVSRPGRIELAAVVGQPSPHVGLSTDGGQHFARVLERTGGYPHVVLDCAGNLVVSRDDVLGVRTAAGDETWRTFPFASRGRQSALYAVAGAIVWFHGDAIAVSGDGGATWHETSAAVARALDRSVPDHVFVVAGSELDAVEWNGLDDRTRLVRFDPLRGIASDEPVHLGYDAAVSWISVAHEHGRWEVRIATPDGVSAGARLSNDDRGAAHALLPRLVGGSSDGDRPVMWCRPRRSSHDCAVLAVRDGVVVREPYSTNGGEISRSLPETPVAGPVLPSSFASDWLAGFDGDLHPLAVVDGVLLRWSDGVGWRALQVGVDPPMWAALVDAATPRAPDPDAHPLAAALRAGFGTNVWRCPASGCALHLARVRCVSGAAAVTCDAVDLANPNATLHATGSAAAQLSAALGADVPGLAAAGISCEPWQRNVHCGIVEAPGDDALAAATAQFRVSSPGRRSRTETPVAVRCGKGSCALSQAGEHATIEKDQAAVLSHVLATRRGLRCGSTGTCNVAAQIACESDGLGDGGVTSIMTCSVTPP